MKKVLWVADAGAQTGFARATHEILDVVAKEYEVVVLGINYRGDPHHYPYPMYVAAAAGDGFGVKRIVEICDMTQPDLIVIQQDGWNFRGYVNQVEKFINAERREKELTPIPIVGIVAVDGLNFQGEWLNGVQQAVFWTKFAQQEAVAGGYEGPTSVIPLGVDTSFFKPMDKQAVRTQLFGNKLPEDAFIVGNVNRNQSRKRWDLTIKYFASWIEKRNHRNAYLFLHCAPTGEDACNVKQLASYYGVFERLALRQPPVHHGVDDALMCLTYNAFDVQVTTTQGEGFGLTTFEGMACGIPQIVPNWSALGELCEGAALLVPCTSTIVGPPYVNVIGGVADETIFVDFLDELYCNTKWRQGWSERARARACESRFQWKNIGRQYLEVLKSAFEMGIDNGIQVERYPADATASA